MTIRNVPVNPQTPGSKKSSGTGHLPLSLGRKNPPIYSAGETRRSIPEAASPLPSESPRATTKTKGACRAAANREAISNSLPRDPFWDLFSSLPFSLSRSIHSPCHAMPCRIRPGHAVDKHTWTSVSFRAGSSPAMQEFKVAIQTPSQILLFHKAGLKSVKAECRMPRTPRLGISTLRQSN